MEAVPAEVEELRSASTTPVNKVEHLKPSQNDTLQVLHRHRQPQQDAASLRGGGSLRGGSSREASARLLREWWDGDGDGTPEADSVLL